MAKKKIEEIEGIGPVNGEKLRAAGIANTDTLLERCCAESGRKAISEETGISAASILKWVNMADLFRINGIAGEFAELLECAGVDTVKELATRNAENLAEKLAEVNDDKKLTRRTPNDAIVKDWIEQAKSLPPKIEH
jgi:predicted flap endonuclease-1-like 5' DNA nuclease